MVTFNSIKLGQGIPRPQRGRTFQYPRMQSVGKDIDNAFILAKDKVCTGKAFRQNLKA